MPPGLLSRNETGSSSSGMTIGWLLAIALGGGALLFVTLAFILVSISDRRAHRARLQAQSEAALVSNEGETTSTDDLNQQHQDRSNHYRDPSRSPATSPVREKRKSLPHILPQIKRNSSILSLFGSGADASKPGQGKVQHSRRKNSWIDEDAIHGPDIKRRESKRITLRDSWLMMRTPTLPALLGYRDDPDTEPFYRHQNYPLITAPRPVALAGDNSQQDRNRTSRLPLVRSPSYELAQQRAAAMCQAADEQQQQERRQQQEQQEAYIQQQLMKQRQHQRAQSQIVASDTHLVPNGPRPPPAAKLARIRTVNTDSNLALILRNTAERLRDGSPAPKRKPTGRNVNRNAQSLVQAQIMADAQSSQHKGHRRTPASLESPIKGFRNDRSSGPVMIGDLSGLQKTPSPKKMPVQAMTTPQSAPASIYERQQAQQASPSRNSTGRFATNGTSHQRNMSTSSMLSEQDSLFGDYSVPDHGEAAPAGLSSPSRRGGQVIPAQPSAQQHQRRRSTSAPSMRSSVSSALSTVYSEEEADHDRSRYRRSKPTQDAPLPRGRGPRQQGHVPKMSDPFLTVDPLAPKLPEKSPRRISVLPPPDYQLPHPSQDASVLGQISGNAQQASPVMSSPILGKEHEHIRLSILMNESPQFSVQPIVRPRSVAPVKPVFKTSNSVSSMRADPSTPEDDKRARRPRTIHGQKPSVVPPPLNLCPVEAPSRAGDSTSQWPAFSINVQGGDSTHPLRQSPTGIRPLPDPELMSPTWAHLKRGGYLDDAPSRGNSNASRRSSVYSETQRGPREDASRNPARSPSSTSKRASPVRMSPLTASIIQLRRMNSQMSAYSAASSIVSDTAAPDSPTLPTLRGGGFSPDRSNSRAVKAGRQNYLSMGTPSPRSKRSTRTGSVIAVDAKAGAGDEKENGRSHDEKSAARQSLKGSFRSAESPRQRLSVRFGEVKEHGPDSPQAAPAAEKQQQEQQRPSAGPEGGRMSGESLYDKDGFLMSSPDRLPSSVAEGARPRSGLRM